MYRMIIFGEDWGRHPSSTQHLAKHLNESQDITWVNSIGLRAPSLNIRDLKRVCEKVHCLLKNIRPVTQKVTDQHSAPFDTLNPVVLPWHNNELVNAFNRKQLRKVLGKRKKDEKRLYWLSLPTALSMLDIEPEDRVVYYCGDDFYALDGVDATMIAKWEPRLIERADLILTASEKLLEKMPRDKSQLIEHGVDLALFSAPTVPHESISKHRPTVGFYGSISEWLDIDLIATLAKARPNYDIMLVGSIKTDVSVLHDLENVFLVDAVDHEELPQFSQHWQALLMPFKLNKQIEACNPLKLREYLAAGQPIVSTEFPAVKSYSQFVRIAENEQQYIDAVTQAVELSEFMRKYSQSKQRESMAVHDWAKRAALVLNQIQKLY